MSYERCAKRILGDRKVQTLKSMFPSWTILVISELANESRGINDNVPSYCLAALQLIQPLDKKKVTPGPFSFYYDKTPLRLPFTVSWSAVSGS
jgi:hypothetical protein